MVTDKENIVDLGAFRKSAREKDKKQTRADKEKQAAANRVRFGRNGAQKKQDKRQSDCEARLHEGHRLSNPGPESSENKD